jgi:cyclase
LKLFSWAKEVESLGAGEILFTSINNDGTKNGYAIEALNELSKYVNIPIIASGGAGKYEHFRDVFKYSNVDAALAASIFHFGIIRIPQLKQYLLKNNINVRI